jgi:cytochrome bd-type quinol oxidase subunit 2
MDGGGLNQMGGNQLTFEAIMTPNFLYFIITLAIVGYLYQTKMILNRENSVKEKSANLFDKQLYLEVGFMILIGLSLYVLNNGDNNTFVWVYMLIPILYLVVKSLMVFNKVSGFISEAPSVSDSDADIADIISQANSKTNTQLPVTNQNSNHVDISNALNNALSKNSQYTNSVGVSPPATQQPPAQMPQQFQMPPNNNIPEGFSLF